MGYYGNDGFIFAWDLGAIFLGIPSFKILRFQRKFFLNLGFKVSQKNVQVVSLYTFFQEFFLLKIVKKCVCVVGLKIAMLFVKNVFINEDISKLGCWVTVKNTTNGEISSLDGERRQVCKIVRCNVLSHSQKLYTAIKEECVISQLSFLWFNQFILN